MAKKGKILRTGVTDAGTLNRGNWTDEYKLCQCGHPKRDHITRQDILDKTMIEYCTACVCMQFKEEK